jgi:hypothetical protein
MHLRLAETGVIAKGSNQVSDPGVKAKGERQRAQKRRSRFPVQPRVATQSLPWEKWRRLSQPRRGCLGLNRQTASELWQCYQATPLGLCDYYWISQGRRHCRQPWPLIGNGFAVATFRNYTRLERRSNKNVDYPGQNAEILSKTPSSI